MTQDNGFGYVGPAELADWPGGADYAAPRVLGALTPPGSESVVLVGRVEDLETLLREGLARLAKARADNDVAPPDELLLAVLWHAVEVGLVHDEEQIGPEGLDDGENREGPRGRPSNCSVASTR